jgi:hypothetical protein
MGPHSVIFNLQLHSHSVSNIIAGAESCGIVGTEHHGMALPGLHVPLVLSGMFGKQFSRQRRLMSPIDILEVSLEVTCVAS